MIKQLLFSAAVAMAFSASAAEPTVLWTAENPEEGINSPGWGDPVYAMTAEQVAEADVQPGDVFILKVMKADGGWPQVAMGAGTVSGWPTLVNEGVGGKEEYPYYAHLQVNSYSMWETICKEGACFVGMDAWISEISLEKVVLPFEVNTNAVWFGPKQCNWGNPVEVNKNALATLTPGDKIIVQYGEGEHTLQFMPGGWGTPNIPTYMAWATNDFLTNNEEASEYYLNFTKAQEAFDWEVDDATETFDLYALYKEKGLMMHGPCLVNQIIYLPNGYAYNNAMAELEAAEKKYEETLAAEKAAHPDFDYAEFEEIIKEAIANDKANLALALASANEDNTNFPAYSTEEINNMIAELELAPLKAENQKAYEAKVAEIEEAEAAYKAAVAALQEEYPGIDLSEWNEIIAAPLAQAKTAAEQALWAANEDGEEYNFPFDAEYYTGMIAEMEKAAPNYAAYSKVIATINALQERYDETVATIKEVNPEFNLEEWADIEENLANAKAGADAALAEANEDGVDFTFAYTGEDVEASIIEMGKAAFAKVNQAAYDKVVAAIAEVEANYTEAVADIEKEYRGIDLSEWKQIIGGQLEEAKKGAEQALAAATDNGELFNFAFDGEEYEGMIAEMKKQAPNYAAYDKVMAEIEAVEEEYNYAVEDIKEVNPDFDFADYKEIEDQIAQAKKGAEQALYAANEDGEDYFFPFSAEDIEAYIAEMKKAGFAAYNQAAYDQAKADLAAIEAKYDAAIVEIETAKPDFDLTEWKDMIGGSLAQDKAGAETAYEVASEYGEKFFFPVDAETYENMIEEMKNAAGVSGIANIEAEVAAGKAKIFTLDGKAHFAPVKGQVNVIVRGNKSVKVMVK